MPLLSLLAARARRSRRAPASPELDPVHPLEHLDQCPLVFVAQTIREGELEQRRRCLNHRQRYLPLGRYFRRADHVFVCILKGKGVPKPAVRDALEAGIQGLWTGELSPAAAAAKMKKLAEPILRQG